MKKDNFLLIGIVDAGWYAKGISSMGCLMSVTSYEVGELPPKDWMVHEGCIVMDGRKVESNTQILEAYRGPMCDVSLPPGSCSKLLDKVSKYTGEKLGSLDSVSLDIFVDIRRKLGYRIGKIEGRKVVWED